jgi:hypothetical protein
MKKIVFGVLGLVVILLVVGVLGYLGIIPGVASLFGWDNPKDLGVTVTAEDYNSAAQKLGRQRLPFPDGYENDLGIAFEGSHPVNTALTQEELTATFQTRDFASNPFSDNGQIRINEDNSVEISGTINVNDLLTMIDTMFTLDESAKNMLNKADFIKGDIPFYVHGSGEVTNNVWDIDIQQFKLGFVSIPTDQIPESSLESAAGNLVDYVTGLDISSMTIENGRVNFDGMYPDTTYYE